MSETDEFRAHLADDDELQAAVDVTAFRPAGNEIVEQVRECLGDEYEVIER